MVVCLIPPRCPLFEWIRENIISSSCGPRAWSVDSVTSIHFQSPNPNLFLFVWFITAIHLVSFSFLLHLLKPTDKDGEGGTHVQNEKKTISRLAFCRYPKDGQPPQTKDDTTSRDFLWPLFLDGRERKSSSISTIISFLYDRLNLLDDPKVEKKKKKSFHTHSTRYVNKIKSFYCSIYSIALDQQDISLFLLLRYVREEKILDTRPEGMNRIESGDALRLKN